MTLILAIIPVLLLIILMAFFKMPGDKSSIISLIVTMLIALFGFSFSADNLFYSFIYFYILHCVFMNTESLKLLNTKLYGDLNNFNK